MTNFWQKLKRPFYVLAPMEEVTDTVFRQIIISIGPPNALFTEFVNVDGLCSKGREYLLHHLKFSEIERPIVSQIWGMNPEHYYKVAQEIVEMGFDGIDINLGCPVKSVVKMGACAALIENQTLAKEIILAALEGAGILPVSIKTRIGLKTIVTEEWFTFLLQFPLDVITVHGRTAKEKSDVPSHWDEIGKVVTMRNQRKTQTLIIGNGDVMNLIEADEKVKQFGVDGVMIGRGIFYNPWLFNIREVEHSVEERLDLLLKHTRLFVKTWGNTKNFSNMKKFFKMYVQGFPGASEIREQLMRCQMVDEVEQTVNQLINT